MALSMRHCPAMSRQTMDRSSGFLDRWILSRQRGDRRDSEIGFSKPAPAERVPGLKSKRTSFLDRFFDNQLRSKRCIANPAIIIPPKADEPMTSPETKSPDRARARREAPPRPPPPSDDSAVPRPPLFANYTKKKHGDLSTFALASLSLGAALAFQCSCVRHGGADTSCFERVGLTLGNLRGARSTTLRFNNNGKRAAHIQRILSVLSMGNGTAAGV